MGRKSKSKKATGSTEVKNDKKLSLHNKRCLNDLTDQLFKVCSNPLQNGMKLWDEHKEIQAILNEIRELESGIARPLFKREEHFDSFFDWMRKNGVAVDNVKVSFFDHEEWGLESVVEIMDGHLWLSVPRSLMLSSNELHQTKWAEMLRNDPISKNLPQVALSLLILEELYTPDSFWMPYLRVLPQEYNTILYFTCEEMELLKGSPCLEDALKHYRHIARQYAYYWQLLNRSNDFNGLQMKNNFTYDSYSF